MNAYLGNEAELAQGSRKPCNLYEELRKSSVPVALSRDGYELDLLDAFSILVATRDDSAGKPVRSNCKRAASLMSLYLLVLQLKVVVTAEVPGQVIAVLNEVAQEKRLTSRFNLQETPGT